MESKKKSSCSCFSFLRRNKSIHVEKSSSPVKVIAKHEAVSQLIANSSDNNFSIDRSLSCTQKLGGSSFNFRTSIVTPSRRTPQMHRLLPSIFSQNICKAVKSELNHSLETSLSRPATIREVPLNPALYFINPRKNEVPSAEASENPKEERREVGKPYGQDNEEVRESPKNEPAENKWVSIKEIISRECENPNYMVSPGISPSLFSNSSKFGFSPPLGSLEVSPIKCVAAMDDCSDILKILSNPEKLQTIPDVFIRNYQKPKHLPMLKPTTPCYFTKKRVLPSTRQDNKILLNKLT